MTTLDPGVHTSFFSEAPRPTPMGGVFLGTCMTALQRGVALGDLLDAIIDHPLCGPWVTLAEITAWAQTVNEIAPRADVPDQPWLDYCTENRIDPITGAAIVLRSVIEDVFEEEA